MKANLFSLISFGCLVVFGNYPALAQAPAGTSCSHVVVGYWHSFDNGVSTVIKLRDVPCCYNVVDVAFLEGAAPGNPAIVFNLDTVRVEKESEFIQDIKLLKSRGVKVLGSIGGANGSVSLPDTNARNAFVSSLIGLIDKFGFDGLDLDIEGGAISLAGGDNDYQHPSTPVIVNLISAMKKLKSKYGAGFWITMAPEVADVQGGISAYANIWGSYLPLIYGLRNEMEFVHVQYYNTGSNTANDGKNYSQGTADFIVAMNDMLLSGFKISNGQTFVPLLESQVAFGLPATTGAAPSGGYTAPAEVTKALDYLTKGTSYGGKYVLSKSFPGLRGIMTWSVNWDNVSSSNYTFGKTYSQYFCGATDLCNTATGLGEIHPQTGTLQVWPDPVQDQMYVSGNFSSATLELYSSAGVLVKRIQGFTGNAISVRELASGFYYLRISDDIQSAGKKIIKY